MPVVYSVAYHLIHPCTSSQDIPCSSSGCMWMIFTPSHSLDAIEDKTSVQWPLTAARSQPKVGDERPPDESIQHIIIKLRNSVNVYLTVRIRELHEARPRGVNRRLATNGRLLTPEFHFHNTIYAIVTRILYVHRESCTSINNETQWFHEVLRLQKNRPT